MNPLRVAIFITIIGKVVLDASVDEVKARYPPCDLTKDWLDENEDPPMCKPCTSCYKDEKEIAPCTATKNRVCSFCEPGFVYSELEDLCRPCGCCDGKHQVQPVCLAAGLSVNDGCISDAPCPPKASNISAAEPIDESSKTIDESSTNNKVWLVVLAVFGTVCVCALLGIALNRLRKHIKRKNTSPQQTHNVAVHYVPNHDEEIAFSEEETGGRTEFSGSTSVWQLPGSFLTSAVGCLWNRR